LSGSTAKAAGKETVFVVDDMKTIRDLVSAQLEQLDCAAEAFASGEECIRALDERQPQLILMDLGMGPMRGDECCRRIKESDRTSHIPIVMLTGTDAAHEVMHSWRAGADDFLPKPIRRSQLASKIQAMRMWNSETAPVASPAVPRRRLLLIESRSFYRSRLGGALEHAGFQILYCKDGSEALKSLAAHRDEIDLLICDLPSLGAEGIVQARQLRGEALPNAPMLLTTASQPTPEIETAARQVSGHEILNKRSVPTEMIMARINSLLKHEALEIRAAERVPFFSVVEFRGDPNDEWLSGFAYDISTRGIFIRTMTTFPTLSKIEMKVRFLAARADISCQGVVAWANPFAPRSSFSYPLGMGVGFEQLDPECEKMVVKLVKSGGRSSSNV
jgi:CheY-like chemotaxis protein